MQSAREVDPFGPRTQPGDGPEYPPDGQRALAAEAAGLTEWLDGDVVRSIYLSPLARERLADGR